MLSQLDTSHIDCHGKLSRLQALSFLIKSKFNNSSTQNPRYSDGAVSLDLVRLPYAGKQGPSKMRLRKGQRYVDLGIEKVILQQENEDRIKDMLTWLRYQRRGSVCWSIYSFKV